MDITQRFKIDLRHTNLVQCFEIDLRHTNLAQRFEIDLRHINLAQRFEIVLRHTLILHIQHWKTRIFSEIHWEHNQQEGVS